MSTAFLESRIAPSLRDRLAKVLLKHHFHVAEFSSDAIIRLRDVSAGLVVIDVKTTGEAGFGTLRRIRREAPDLKVLVLTPRTPANTAGRALTLGATEYLVKPFEEAEISHVLERLNHLWIRSSVADSSGTKYMNSAQAKLRVPLQELHDSATGRLDAERIATYLGVPLSKLASALGANYTAMHKTPTAASLQTRLSPIKRSLEVLSEVIGDRTTVRAWLNREHPDLGMRTPISVILEGHADAVRTILENALAGIPA